MRRLLSLGLLLAMLGTPSPARAVGARDAPGRPDLVRAITVLHDWDVRRASAWATGDEEGLRSLYVRGSGAGAADLRLLRAYAGRGLVVRVLRTQVFAIEVLHASGRSMRLRVLDRVAGGEVDDGDREAALPVSKPALRLIEFRRVEGTWKVSAVQRAS